MTVDGVVNIRAERTDQSRRMGRLAPGSQVLARDLRDRWYAIYSVASSRHIGYVREDLLRLVPAPSSLATMSATDRVNIRSARTIRARRVVQLVPGQAVLAGDLRRGWYAVYAAAGPNADRIDRPEHLGYVRADLLGQPPTEGPEGTDRADGGSDSGLAEGSFAQAAEGTREGVVEGMGASGVSEPGKPEPGKPESGKPESGKPEPVVSDSGKPTSFDPDSAAARSASTAESASFQKMTVDEAVNIRAGRGVTTPRVGRLSPGDVVEASDLLDGWYAVRKPGPDDAEGENGADNGGPRPLLGYVYEPLLQPLAEDDPRVPPTWYDRFSLADTTGLQARLSQDFTVIQGYNDNIEFEGIADFETMLQYGIKLTLGTERTNAELRSWSAGYFYPANRDLNHIDHRYQAIVSHALTERLRLEATGKMGWDRRFEFELAQSGKAITATQRKSLALLPGLVLQASELDELRVTGEFEIIRHSDDEDADSRVTGLEGQWRHALRNERTAVVTRGALEEYSYHAGTQTVSRFQAGVEHGLTETVTLSLLGGLHGTATDFSRNGGRGDGQDSGLALDATVTKRFEASQLSLGYSLGPAPTSSGENVERSAWKVRLEHAFDERFEGVLAYSLVRGESRGYWKKMDDETEQYMGELVYNYTEDIDFSVKYQHTVSRDMIDETNEKSNRIQFLVTVRFPEEL